MMNNIRWHPPSTRCRSPGPWRPSTAPLQYRAGHERSPASAPPARIERATQRLWPEGSAGGRSCSSPPSTNCAWAAARAACAERKPLSSSCGSSLATTCPEVTRSPTLADRSIIRPEMRNDKRASFSAWNRPVYVTVSPTSRLTTVTVQTDQPPVPRFRPRIDRPPAKPPPPARQAGSAAVRSLDHRCRTTA